MTEGARLIVYPVTDVAKAKDLYGTLLGVEPYADQPYYVGYRIDGQEIGLDPNGHRQGLTGALPYWYVADIRASLDALLGAGAEELQAVRDVGGGRLVALVKDADGNTIGLVQREA